MIWPEAQVMDRDQMARCPFLVGLSLVLVAGWVPLSTTLAAPVSSNQAQQGGHRHRLYVGAA